MVAWGLDCSTKCIALCVYDGDRFEHWPTIRFQPVHKGAQRLAHAHALLTPWLFDASHWTPPDAVFVEQPAGKFPKPTLEHMVGVVLMTVAEVTTAPVLTLPVPQWKHMSIGKGNASKEQLMEWARERGYEGDSQDEADALGIAVAGHHILERDVREAA
jgi:Holliday junction resolvasome RuvABC endonuclease subunit